MSGRLSLLIALAVGSAWAQPTISPGGVVNAAGMTDGTLPNSGIAQGSILAIVGTGLGPAEAVRAAAASLSNELGGTSVRVTAQGNTVTVPVLYASATRVAALLPSATPTGSATVTVSFNGQTSAASSFQVVQAAFGIFTRSGSGGGPAWTAQAATPMPGPYNSLTTSGKPGGVYTITGTGLGALAGDQPTTRNLPVDVTVLIGDKTARVIHKSRPAPGLDQISFVVPSDAQEGCYLPLTVRTAGGVSNFTSMAISSSSARCAVPGSFTAADLDRLASGGSLNVGVVTLGRSRLQITVPIFGSLAGNNDTGDAAFLRYDADTLNAARGVSEGFGIPPFGTCTVFPSRTTGSIDAVTTAPGLDAGAAINVKGPVATKPLTPSGPAGVYHGALGGTPPNLPGLPGAGQSLPDFLVPGSYTVDNGGGGSAVGSFTASMQIAAPVTWSNQAAITNVPRTRPLTITWTGGTANQYVAITGFSYPTAGSGAGFSCTERASAGSFTVPADVLSLLPVSASTFGIATGALNVTTWLQGDDQVRANVPGLDVFLLTYSDTTTKLVGFQ
ncbi:MAG: hypothetical protein HYZ37_17585 [Candidatus Solibacter usitatus]|nr:hypothetical protein [Candidatus Solibacter usitatus]